MAETLFHILQAFGVLSNLKVNNERMSSNNNQYKVEMQLSLSRQD